MLRFSSVEIYSMCVFRVVLYSSVAAEIMEPFRKANDLEPLERDKDTI